MECLKLVNTWLPNINIEFSISVNKADLIKSIGSNHFKLDLVVLKGLDSLVVDFALYLIRQNPLNEERENQCDKFIIHLSLKNLIINYLIKKF